MNDLQASVSFEARRKPNPIMGIDGKDDVRSLDDCFSSNVGTRFIIALSALYENVQKCSRCLK